MNAPRVRGFLLTAAFAAMAASVVPQSADSSLSTPFSPSLSADQIVERIVSHDRQRTNELRSYKSLRHYEVEYRGFSSKVNAKMDVVVDYDASSGKHLVIASESGSKFLLEKVLKRAVDSEREAFQQKNSTALTTANYRFNLLGQENVAGRPAYIMNVEPLVASKFLYRGKIWVDAGDFVVVKMKTEPSKSPSFWISQTEINFTSARIDGFWMPQQMRSETSVRIGGVAVFTIDYGKYQIASSPSPETQAALGR